jgi:FixJ family two-component response regulator
LDFAMPGMDGVETLRALREHNPDIQVMLLTGQATIKAAVEANRLGAVDVLEKPTDIGTLMEKIREARAKHLLAKEQRSQGKVDDILHKYGW